MGLRVKAETHRFLSVEALAANLGSDMLQHAAALGLNEHTQEQKRQSVVRISAFTGVPSGYVQSKASIRSASPGPVMNSEVRVRDKALNIGQFGSPVWDRSMTGAEFSGWNVRRTVAGSFVRNGKVMKREGEKRYPLRAIWGPVLASELLRTDWKSSIPNPEMAERFMASDLTARVFRIMSVKMGF